MIPNPSSDLPTNEKRPRRERSRRLWNEEREVLAVVVIVAAAVVDVVAAVVAAVLVLADVVLVVPVADVATAA